MELGPKVCGTLLRMELQGELEVLSLIHSVDDWMIRLTRSCQQSGIMLSFDPPEQLAPLGVDAVYQVTYQWCCKSGDYPLVEMARKAAETTYQVAPGYRWK